MMNRTETPTKIMRSNVRLLTFGSALFCALAVFAMPSMQAQTLNVLFTNSYPPGGDLSGIALDTAGNLYGTIYYGTPESVFELKRDSPNWVLQPLYDFHDLNDGHAPYAPLVFGPDGALYGTTIQGGYNGYLGDGTVFSVRPSSHPCESVICLGSETRVYWFGGSENSLDGYFPNEIMFDAAGNIYGTTLYGGRYGLGTAYELTPTQNGWTETILDNFSGNGGPEHPSSGLTFDAAGNLYGTANGGAYGVVYELVRSGHGWTEKTLYSFQGRHDGGNPVGGLVFDAAGNAYGTTAGTYNSEPGTVFELSPQSDGTWSETVLYVFPGNGPLADLVKDSAGNLYGTTPGTPGNNPDHNGMVFKLSQTGGVWSFTQLYEFTGGADDAFPGGRVAIDSAGNIYGQCIASPGTIWELTP